MRAAPDSVGLGEALAAATATLEAAGIDTARADAEWLLAHALGIGRMQVRMALARELPEAEAARFAEAVGRRAAREPLQRILGWEEFHGVRLRVRGDVLVPRPETEILAGWSLELLPPPRPGRRPRIVDLGTGSGCLACALAHARPDVEVIAVDRSLAAADLARDNARSLGLDGRVRVVAADLLSAFRPFAADLVVANAPYLPSGMLDALPAEVSRHEPRAALDGGPDGLALIRRIVADAGCWLRPGGALALETAGDAQLPAVATLLAEAGLVGVETRRDLAGIARHVAARRAAEGGGVAA